eukprot:11873950-Ditylum_brightwellii.AAC.1
MASNQNVATVPLMLGNRSEFRYCGSGGSVAGGGTSRTTSGHMAKSATPTSFNLTCTYRELDRVAKTNAVGGRFHS